MKHKYDNLLVRKEESILSVMKKMDDVGRKLLIVIDNEHFASLISIGDIQRAIINGFGLTSPISSILRDDVKVASPTDDVLKVKERMMARRNEFMPIVSSGGELVDVIFWEDLIEEKRPATSDNKLGLPVVIMAGGMGTRLRPLTNVLPKALIPIHDKTIIEDIMDRFVECGCNCFYLSINHKSEMIRYYFNSINNSHYRIDYIMEDKPLGTAGSLHLLKNKIKSTLFVSNCDIIVDQDYEEILRYHRDNDNEITIVAALKSFPIPYGTVTTGEDGLLQTIEEKPEAYFKINTGFYILEPSAIQEIPDGQFYHITDLIQKFHDENRRVGVFPISDRSWIDIGNWREYLSYIRINH